MVLEEVVCVASIFGVVDVYGGVVGIDVATGVVGSAEAMIVAGNFASSTANISLSSSIIFDLSSSGSAVVVGGSVVVG